MWEREPSTNDDERASLFWCLARIGASIESGCRMCLCRETRMADEYRDKVEVVIVRTLREVVLTSVDVAGRILRIAPAETIEGMLKGDNIRLFVRAFTHKSYDYSESYEIPEFGGDAFLNAIITDGITTQFPNMDPEELTNMVSHYKSNKVFADIILTNIPNLSAMILTNAELGEKVYADVFEAMMRVVYVTANSIKPGIGFAVLQNVYAVMTRDPKFRYSEKYAVGNPKSVVLEMFDRGTVTETPGKGGPFTAGDTITVIVDHRAITEFNLVLNKNRTTVPLTTLIGRGAGNDRGTASTRAYEQILTTLGSEQYKITPQIFRNAKQTSVINEFPNSARVRAKQDERKENLTFQKKNSSEKGMVDWDLISQSRVDGKRRLVASETVSKDSSGFNAAKERLLERYLLKK